MRIAGHYFEEHGLHFGRVVGRRINQTNGKPFIDIIPNDMGTVLTNVPFLNDFNRTRLPRIGQQVSFFFMGGLRQYPCAVGRQLTENNAPLGYIDALPTPNGVPIVEYVDDDVIFHPETQAYERVRNLRASDVGIGTNPPPADDQSPALWERTLASGASIRIMEEAPDDMSPPNQATLEYESPSGALLQIAEPSVGNATFTLSLPNGFYMTVDVDGNMVVQSPQTATVIANEVVVNSADTVIVNAQNQVNVVAPKIVELAADIELGADGGATLAYHAELAALATWAATHTHPANGEPPSTTPPISVGTMNTHAI